MKIRKLITELQKIEKKRGNIEVVIDRESVENYIIENTHPSLWGITTEFINTIDGEGYIEKEDILVCVIGG